MFIKIFLFFLILNGTLGMFNLFFLDVQSEAVFGINNNQSNPNVAVNFTTTATPEIYDRFDPTNPNTTAGHFVSLENNTQSGDPFSGIFDLLDPLLEATRVFGFVTGFFSGAFIFEAIDAFSASIGLELPDGFIFLMEVIVGIIFMMWVLFTLFNRGASSFT